MTRNREKGNAPSDVNFTLADSIFSQEQNQKIWEIAQHMEMLDVKLLDSLIAFGKTLEEWLTDHPLEDTARRVLLAPLHSDGVELAKLLRRLQTRLLMSAPARTKEQFDAAISLQLQDAGVAVASAGNEAEPVTPCPGIESAKTMAAVVFAAVAASQGAIGAAMDASDYRRDSIGRLTALEAAAYTAMHAAGKKNAAALAAIHAWRCEQALREEGQEEPAA